MVIGGITGKGSVQNDSRALQIAAHEGNLTLIEEILLEGNEAINQGTETPLMLAVKRGHYFAITTLLDAGADPNIPNEQEYTPLHVAAARNYTDIALALVERGAKVNLKTKQGFTALLYACGNGNARLVEGLLDEGASLNAADYIHGDVCIMHAITSRNTALVSWLLRRDNTQVNARSMKLLTPLMQAVRIRDGAMVELILGYDQDLKATDYVGNTAEWYGLDSRNQAIIVLLRKHSRIKCES